MGEKKVVLVGGVNKTVKKSPKEIIQGLNVVGDIISNIDFEALKTKEKDLELEKELEKINSDIENEIEKYKEKIEKKKERRLINKERKEQERNAKKRDEEIKREIRKNRQVIPDSNLTKLEDKNTYKNVFQNKVKGLEQVPSLDELSILAREAAKIANRKELLEKERQAVKQFTDRADVIYGSDDEYYSKYPRVQNSSKSIWDNEQNEEDVYLSEQIAQIADFEKLLYPNGTIADGLMNSEIDWDKLEKEHFAKTSKNSTDKKDSNIGKLLTLAAKAGVSKDKDDIKLVFNAMFEMFPLSFNFYKENGIRANLINYLLSNEAIQDIPQEKLTNLIDIYLQGDERTLALMSVKVGPDGAGLLRISAKDSDMKNSYTKDAALFSSSSELPDKFKGVVQKKLSSQNLKKDSRGVFFPPTSDPANRLASSKDLRNLIRKEIKNIPIKNSKYANRTIDGYNTSLEFKNIQMNYAYGKADIIDMKINDKGELNLTLLDTTDYNKNDKRNIVKAARVLQDAGIIEPIFVLVNVVIPPIELKLILETEN